MSTASLFPHKNRNILNERNDHSNHIDPIEIQHTQASKQPNSSKLSIEPLLGRKVKIKIILAKIITTEITSGGVNRDNTFGSSEAEPSE